MSDTFNNIEKIDGSVTAAKGFCAAGVAAHIKYTDRKDMAMIFTKECAKVAGKFTSNVVKAAPVKYDMDIVTKGVPVHAVVVNSGIANAATGAEGMRICSESAKEAARLLNIPDDSVLVGSTGVIGEQLPLDNIKNGIKMLCDSLSDTR